MTQFSPVPRNPRSTTARERRAASAFQLFGGEYLPQLVSDPAGNTFSVRPPVDTVVWSTGATDRSIVIPNIGDFSNFYRDNFLKIKKSDAGIGSITISAINPSTYTIDDNESIVLYQAGELVTLVATDTQWRVWSHGTILTGLSDDVHETTGGFDYTIVPPVQTVFAFNVTVTLPNPKTYNGVVVRVKRLSITPGNTTIVTHDGSNIIDGSLNTVKLNTTYQAIGFFGTLSGWDRINEFNP